jgi:uncharacterized membrane protein YhiD involved in acid resistance
MQDLIDLFGSSENIDIMTVLVNIVLSGAMAGVIYLVFIRFGNTLSNRKQFGRIFFLIAVCTTVIISIIKASIALSLGLVGALSIVRFRAAIKEPEELAYLFFCIAVGLGFGADARAVTFAAGFLIIAIIVVYGLVFKRNEGNELYNISISSSTMKLSEINVIMEEYATRLKLRRVDSEQNNLNSLFMVEFAGADQLENAIQKLQAKDPAILVSYVSSEAII